MGFPLGCGSSLALGCVAGQSRVNIVHVFCFGQGVRVTLGGHGLMRQRRMVSFRGGQGGSRTAPTGGGESGSAGGAPSGGMDSCLRRKDDGG